MNRKKRLLLQKQIIEEKGIICLENVSKTYQNNVPALTDVSINIYPGEFVFVVGDSGSGKSTFIKLLLRELTATEGTVYVMGRDVAKIRHSKIAMFRRNIGVVFQDFRLLKDRNVFDNVAFAQRIAEVSPREIRSNVPRIISEVGLGGKYKAKVRNLAGGEQQRVAIARALVNSPSILLADEPTGNLDPKNTWEIMRLLDEINAKGTTVIVVTHNREIVNSMQKRVITIKQGAVVSDEGQGGYTDED